MGVASLVLGILGLLVSTAPCVGAFGLILTIPGLFLGMGGIDAAKNTHEGKGCSIAGLVLSIIGTVIGCGWLMGGCVVTDALKSL